MTQPRGTGISRRAVLGLSARAAVAVAVGSGLSGCAVGAGPEIGPDGTGQTGPVQTVRYGEDPSQFVELMLPASATGPVPVAVVIHGGFWRSAYGLDLGRPLAATLPGRGWAALNIEYRRLGNGGGYPATLTDVGSAIDLLATTAASAARTQGIELDLTRVTTIGHSAGGHLAAWAATRPGQDAGAPGARPAVEVSAVVSQAGVLDLRACARSGLGGGAAQALLGGEPDQFPDRYREASPIERLPLGVPTLCVHAPGDGNVPISQSEALVEAAIEAGDDAELIVVPGDHFVVIDPEDRAWRVVLDWLDR